MGKPEPDGQEERQGQQYEPVREFRDWNRY
jgi:hypothetical protein